MSKVSDESLSPFPVSQSEEPREFLALAVSVRERPGVNLNDFCFLASENAARDGVSPAKAGPPESSCAPNSSAETS